MAQRIVRDTALAEDIVHDAFIKIWRSAGSFDPLRGAAREIGVDDAAFAGRDASASLAHWADAADSFAWQGCASQIARCMEQRDLVRRNCVLHAYVDGLSHREIAERVDAPAGTVKSWIKRSLASLKQCLS